MVNKVQRDLILNTSQFLFWNIMNIFEQIAKLKENFNWISTDHLDSTINILYLFLSSACLFIHSSLLILIFVGLVRTKVNYGASVSHVQSSSSFPTTLQPTGIFSFFESVRLF